MIDEDGLLLRSRLTIHRQLNPNYAGSQLGGDSGSKSSRESEDCDDDDDKNWDRPGNVVAKRNARERTRVHTVNQAFLVLKSHLPSLRSHTKRVSKLKILRAAINYIEALLDLLKDDPTRNSHNHYKQTPLKHSVTSFQSASALADRSLAAAPLSYPVNVQSLLDSHSYIYPPGPPPPTQPHIIHPFLLNY